MSKGEFRFSYFTPEYEATLAFYRDGLGFPVLESWDRNLDDRGTLFTAAFGVIEVLARPGGAEPAHLWDRRPPQGAFISSCTCSARSQDAARDLAARGGGLSWREET